MKKTSSKIKTSPQEKFLHVLNVFFLLIAVFLCVYPFYYMVIYSLSDSTRASLEGIYFLPKGFTLDAYKNDPEKIRIRTCFPDFRSQNSHPRQSCVCLVPPCLHIW